jgi:radical SAM protein with 4Fe4S-binding SPASM domain
MIPKDHLPSFTFENGKLYSPLGKALNISGLTEKKKIVVENETIVSLVENKELFKNLRHVNMLLTNACNLSCSYCYEQHNKDFGKFTIETINELHSWFKKINPSPKKTLSFFGGEPLVHKEFILEWLNQHKIEQSMSIGMTTNGLLLSKNFINHYYSFPDTIMMVSLDTHICGLDQRKITQTQMDHLLDMIQYATSVCKSPTRFAIRATVTRETAPYIEEFWAELYNRGVRQLTIHPLILSQAAGYVEWEEEEWNTFTTKIKNLLLETDDFEHLKFAEGIGLKGETNCLTGSDTIAIDPSGDFSGCYFFTNRKQQLDKFLLGNIFDDELYIDRFKDFHAQYEEIFKLPECQDCNFKNTCYQCPAGNASTGQPLFKPDAMCKRFAQLHTEFHEIVIQKHFKKIVKDLTVFVATEGTIAYTYSLISLIFKYITDYYLFTDDMKTQISREITFEKATWFLVNLVKNKNKSPMSLEEILEGIRGSEKMSPAEGYVELRKISEGREPAISSQNNHILYVALLHLVVVNLTHPKTPSIRGLLQ